MSDEILKAFLASLGTDSRGIGKLLPVLQGLLDLLPIRFYIKDRDHRFVMANRKCVEATGMKSFDELRGKTDRHLFVPEDAVSARNDEEAILRDPNQAINGKEELETWANGRQRWVKTWKWPWFDETGQNVVGIIGLSAEITQSTDFFDRIRQAASNAPLGLWHRNLETNQVWFSPRWKAILGYQDDDFPNTYEHLLKNIHPGDLEHFKAETSGYLDRFQKRILEGNLEAQPETYQCEFRMRHRNSKWIWIQSQGAATLDEMGRSVFAGSHADITKVKEKLLFYEQLIDSVPTYIFVKNPDHEFVFVNQTLANAYGRDKKYFEKKTDADLNHDTEQVKKFWEDDETVLRGKEGKLRIAEEKLSIEKDGGDGSGNQFLATEKQRMWSELYPAPQVLGVATDITPLRAAQNEIVQGNRQLDFLMAHAPDGIFIKDLNRCFVRVSNTLAELAGFEASDLVGKTDWDLFHDEEYSEKSREEEEEIIATRRSRLNILRLTPTQNGKRYRLISKVPVLDDQGNVMYIMGISKDVHNIVDGRATLLESVLDTIPQFVFVKHRDGRYMLVNRNFAERHGETTRSMVGKTDFDLWSAEEARRYQADDREILATNRPRKYYAEEQLFTDGRRRKLETSKIPLSSTAGPPDLVLGIYSDVTERLTERETEVHRKVIHSLSHCLKQWVLPLETSLSVLVKDAPALADTRSYSRLQRQLWTMKQSIELATRFASLDSIPHVNKQPVDVGELLDEIADVLTDFLPQIPVEISKPADRVVVPGDAAHLRNVIAQLVTNAKRALLKTSSPLIQIRVESTDGFCSVHVIDNGPGVPEEMWPVLFELSEIKTKFHPQSTGLGLHYAQCVAKAHEGTIDAIRTPDAGKGAHFVLRLPRRTT